LAHWAIPSDPVYFPTPHVLHEVDPVTGCAVPDGHAMQMEDDELPSIASEKVPAEHFWHAVAPALVEKWAAGHAWHTVATPGTDTEKRPQGTGADTNGHAAQKKTASAQWLRQQDST
jgi:hypothetical protein